MSWLNVTVKIPASWWPDRDESEYPFNVFACIANTLYDGDGNIDVDTTDDGDLHLLDAPHPDDEDADHYDDTTAVL